MTTGKISEFNVLCTSHVVELGNMGMENYVQVKQSMPDAARARASQGHTEVGRKAGSPTQLMGMMHAITGSSLA